MQDEAFIIKAYQDTLPVFNISDKVNEGFGIFAVAIEANRPRRRNPCERRLGGLLRRIGLDLREKQPHHAVEVDIVLWS